MNVRCVNHDFQLLKKPWTVNKCIILCISWKHLILCCNSILELKKLILQIFENFDITASQNWDMILNHVKENHKLCDFSIFSLIFHFKKLGTLIGTQY